MTSKEMFELPFSERQFFEECRGCGEWFDLRIFEELIAHLAHAGLPRYFTLLWTCRGCDMPMQFELHRNQQFAGVWRCSRCGIETWTMHPPKLLVRGDYFKEINKFAGRWIQIGKMEVRLNAKAASKIFPFESPEF